MNDKNEPDTILKLIETIDPADKATLDEIDARVFFLVRGSLYQPKWLCKIGANDSKQGCDWGEPRGADGVPHYSRSRDALKVIRPAHSWLETSVDINDDDTYSYRCRLWYWSESRQQREPALPTEELAGLHAIIQAIEYERRSGLWCAA